MFFFVSNKKVEQFFPTSDPVKPKLIQKLMKKNLKNDKSF